MTRFPEKQEFTPEMYAKLLDRVTNLEQNSVHKDAVKALVLAVKDVKDEFATVKTGMGLNNPKTAEILAMLNGHPIGVSEDETNG